MFALTSLSLPDQRPKGQPGGAFPPVSGLVKKAHFDADVLAAPKDNN